MRETIKGNVQTARNTLLRRNRFTESVVEWIGRGQPQSTRMDNLSAGCVAMRVATVRKLTTRLRFLSIVKTCLTQN